MTIRGILHNLRRPKVSPEALNEAAVMLLEAAWLAASRMFGHKGPAPIATSDSPVADMFPLGVAAHPSGKKARLVNRHGDPLTPWTSRPRSLAQIAIRANAWAVLEQAAQKSGATPDGQPGAPVATDKPAEPGDKPGPG